MLSQASVALWSLQPFEMLCFIQHSWARMHTADCTSAIILCLCSDMLIVGVAIVYISKVSKIHFTNVFNK